MSIWIKLFAMLYKRGGGSVNEFIKEEWPKGYIGRVLDNEILLEGFSRPSLHILLIMELLYLELVTMKK